MKKRLTTLRKILDDPHLAREEKALSLASALLHRSDRLALARQTFFELTAPPAVFRGMRDLLVRRGTDADVAAIAAVRGCAESTVRRRLASGDHVFVGDLEGRVLAHIWLHPGPAPFREDEAHLARWQLANDTFWSFDAATAEEARASGVFVKVFQTALREALTTLGAARVQSMANVLNHGSIAMHERLGFRRLGILTVARLGPVSALRWDGEAPARTRSMLGRSGRFALRVPPV